MKINGIIRLLLTLSLGALVCSCASITGGSPGSDIDMMQSILSERKNTGSIAGAYYHFSLSQALLIEQKYDEAIREMETALEYDPGTAYLYAALSELHMDQGEIERALEIGLKAVEVDPNYAYGYVLLGGYYIALDRMDQAISAFQKALELDPDHREVPLYLADLYEGREEIGKTRGILEDYVKRHPRSTEGLYRLGGILLREGEYDRAREMFQRVLQLDPTHRDALVALGLLLEKEGEIGAAVDIYVKALEAGPQNNRLRAYLIDLYLRQDRFDEAERENQILEMFGYDALTVHVNNGLIAMGRGDPGQAASHFESALKEEPGNDRLLYFLGTAHLRSGALDRALACFNAIKQESDFYPDALFGAGFILRETGDLQEAEYRLRTAAELDPLNVDYRRLLALVYMDQKRYQETEEVILQSLKIEPENLDVRFLLGNLYEKTREYRKGIAAMRKILDISPNHPDALNYIGYTYAEQGMRLKEAEELIRRALMAKPDDGYVTDSLGWVYYKQGRFREALDTLSRANRLAPDEPVIIEHLGDAYLAVGDKVSAKIYYQRALQLSDDEERIESIGRKLENLNR